jgi:anti-sigma factor RsiW
MSGGVGITCRELVRIITDYLEDALAPNDRERFDAHLAACSGCRAYLEQMRAVISLTGRLAEEDIAPPAREPLLAAFRGWRERSAG